MSTCLVAPAWAADPIFNDLRPFLVAQGFPIQEVEAWLGDSRLEFEAKTLARMFSVSESKLNYKQFLAKSVVRRAKAFQRQQAKALKRVERQTGVSSAVVVAILAVETNLGSYMGRHRVFNVLASQAVMDKDPALERMARFWPREQLKDLRSDKNQKRFRNRAEWARDELAHLIRLSRLQGVSPLEPQGSPAGAVGMAQFIPSSILRHGTDGDADGKVDLTRPEDAIASVGVYLKDHGWRPGLTKAQQLEVILTYNRSRPYARTVLALARRLG